MAAAFPYSDPSNLRDALNGLAERERSGEPSYPLCCCLLYSSRHALGRVLASWAADTLGYLDRLTADNLLVFVPERHTDSDERDRPRRARRRAPSRH